MIRSLVHMGMTDGSVIEVIIKQLILHLNQQLTTIHDLQDKEQIASLLQYDVLTGYAKAIGELLILLHTSGSQEADSI